MKPENFKQMVEWRRSVRIYDEGARFDSSVVDRAIDMAILAPTSSNLQLFEIHRVKNTDKRKELAGYCLSQPAATTANELVVFVVRRDLWKKRARFNYDELSKRFGSALNKTQKMSLSYYSKLIPLVYGTDPLGLFGWAKRSIFWLMGFFSPIYREVSLVDNRIIAHKSCALVAQTFMLAVASEGYDSCPMEGVDTCRVRKFLGLPQGAEINMVVSVGQRKPEGIYGERLRLPSDELVRTL